MYSTSSWDELVIQATKESERIRHLDSWESPEAIEIAQSLVEISSFLDEEWKSLKELTNEFKAAIENGELKKEDDSTSRNKIADAINLSIGSCVQMESAQIFFRVPNLMFNLDWGGLTEQATKLKKLSSLMPSRCSELKPQAYKEAIVTPVIFEKLNQAIRKIYMQTDAQKVLEGEQFLEEAKKLAEENQIEKFDSLFRMLSIQAQLHSGESLDENERAQLEAQFLGIVSSGKEGSPGYNIFKSSGFLKNASKYLVDGFNSLRIANLDEASQSMDEAEKLLESATSALQQGDTKHVLASTQTQLIEGYQALVDAQRVYVNTLNASFMGTLQSTHVDKLKASDQMLFKFGEPVKQACLVLKIPPETSENFEQLFKTQRTANRNLRRLAEIALSPKNLSRVATGMFLVYFVITFVIITVVMRLSGTIENLEPTTIVFLLITSFAAALIAAFGYQALKFLPFLKILAGGEK